MNSELVTAAGAATAAILGAWALVVKARGTAAKPLQVLHRLWDWIQYSDLEGVVPPVLAEDVRDLVSKEEPDR